MSASSGVEQGGAPSWLFSFVDLAFLMLIAMTLIASDYAGAPDLGQMVVPRIAEESTQELAGSLGTAWQLRVHPPALRDSGAAEPFELVLTHSGTLVQSLRLNRAALQHELAALREKRRTKPLLAPHEDSRTQDFLVAAALMEDLWPSRRRAVVSRLVDR